MRKYALSLSFSVSLSHTHTHTYNKHTHTHNKDTHTHTHTHNTHKQRNAHTHTHTHRHLGWPMPGIHSLLPWLSDCVGLEHGEYLEYGCRVERQPSRDMPESPQAKAC